MKYTLVIIIFVLSTYLGGKEKGRDVSNIKIKVTNISKGNSNVMVAIFSNPETFLSEDRYFSKVISVSNISETTLDVSLPKGDYAIAIFQDQNMNGVLDRNMFYYPTEPYGFSNNYRPVIRAPRWDDAAFYADGDQVIEVKLK